MSTSLGHSWQCSYFLWISSFNLANKAVLFHICRNIVCQGRGDLLLFQHFTSIWAQVNWLHLLLALFQWFHQHSLNLLDCQLLKWFFLS